MKCLAAGIVQCDQAEREHSEMCKLRRAEEYYITILNTLEEQNNVTHTLHQCQTSTEVNFAHGEEEILL